MEQDYRYDSTISNELFLFAGASLANRVPASSKQFYLNWALKEWAWFCQSGLINAHHTINNNLNLTSCKNDGAPLWTYNQGVILAGLVELQRATSYDSYISVAKEIARGAISQMKTADGILRESCDPHCLGNGQQFKGVFMRGLEILQGASPEDDFKTFIEVNAESIWQNARGPGGFLGSAWSGPFNDVQSVQSQSSACDALMAAVAVSGS